MAVLQRFCEQCGAPHSGNAVFCVSCGNRLQAPAAAPQAPVAQYPMPMQPMPPPNAGAYPPQMPAPVQNWQVVVGNQLPVIAPQQQPAAAMVAPQPAAMATANYRAGFAVAGLIAGRRRGVASVIVMLGTLGLTLLEGMTLWGFVQQIQVSPQLLQGLLPNVIPQALTMFTSLSTAFSALRRT